MTAGADCWWCFLLHLGASGCICTASALRLAGNKATTRLPSKTHPRLLLTLLLIRLCIRNFSFYHLNPRAQHPLTQPRYHFGHYPPRPTTRTPPPTRPPVLPPATRQRQVTNRTGAPRRDNKTRSLRAPGRPSPLFAAIFFLQGVGCWFNHLRVAASGSWVGSKQLRQGPLSCRQLEPLGQFGQFCASRGQKSSRLERSAPRPAGRAGIAESLTGTTHPCWHLATT